MHGGGYQWGGVGFGSPGTHAVGGMPHWGTTPCGPAPTYHVAQPAQREPHQVEGYQQRLEPSPPAQPPQDDRDIRDDRRERHRNAGPTPPRKREGLGERGRQRTWNEKGNAQKRQRTANDRRSRQHAPLVRERPPARRRHYRHGSEPDRHPVVRERVRESPGRHETHRERERKSESRENNRSRESPPRRTQRERPERMTAQHEEEEEGVFLVQQSQESQVEPLHGVQDGPRRKRGRPLPAGGGQPPKRRKVDGNDDASVVEYWTRFPELPINRRGPTMVPEGTHWQTFGVMVYGPCVPESLAAPDSINHGLKPMMLIRRHASNAWSPGNRFGWARMAAPSLVMGTMSCYLETPHYDTEDGPTLHESGRRRRHCKQVQKLAEKFIQVHSSPTTTELSLMGDRDEGSSTPGGMPRTLQKRLVDILISRVNSNVRRGWPRREPPPMTTAGPPEWKRLGGPPTTPGMLDDIAAIAVAVFFTAQKYPTLYMAVALRGAATASPLGCRRGAADPWFIFDTRGRESSPERFRAMTVLPGSDLIRPNGIRRLMKCIPGRRTGDERHLTWCACHCPVTSSAAPASAGGLAPHWLPVSGLEAVDLPRSTTHGASATGDCQLLGTDLSGSDRDLDDEEHDEPMQSIVLSDEEDGELPAPDATPTEGEVVLSQTAATASNPNAFTALMGASSANRAHQTASAGAGADPAQPSPPPDEFQASRYITSRVPPGSDPQVKSIRISFHNIGNGVVRKMR